MVVKLLIYQIPLSILIEPMRPGYNLYMDISTIGNYYGENLDTSGEYTDSNLYLNP